MIDNVKVDLLDNKYRIEELLGEGGMGTVYKATHLGTKRTVAVKIIHPQLSRYDEFVERFRREAEAAGRLRHPNVVDVTDFGFAQTSEGPVAYLVMEYLDGCTLADVLAEERLLPVPWVVDILEQVSSALDQAHGLGIVHRDLKPDNIWLEPNRRGGYTIKVLDFGLVKLGAAGNLNVEVDRLDNPIDAQSLEDGPADDSRTLLLTREENTLLKSDPGEQSLFALTSEGGRMRSPGVDSNGRPRQAQPATDAQRVWKTDRANALTRVGAIMGTPPYMSPEQCRGEKLDARSDIYSLGVIAYRMLTGETPFTGTHDELFALHKTAVPPPLRAKNHRVPRRLARVVMSALEKDPAQRPQSAGGFSSALRASIESSGQLLRHAVALYSEHFPSFLKISLLGYAPVMAALVFANLDRLTPSGQWSTLGQSAYGILAFVAMIVSTIMAYFIVSAATVPVVVQLMIAPLRQVRMAIVLTAIRRRWVVLLGASVVVMGSILLGSLLLVIPGALAAVYFSLYTPVVMMEGLGVRATLKRAGQLVRRAWLRVLTIALLQFALPIMVWHASISTSFTFKLDENYRPREFGLYFSMSGGSALYQLLNVFVTPLTAIMISLLYLQTRQAGGETLKDASDHFAALDIPRSNWQARMRRSSIASTRS